MTEIRRPEAATPEMATALYDAYVRCDFYVDKDGQEVWPTFEAVFNAALRAPRTVAYLSLCASAILHATLHDRDGQRVPNPEGVDENSTSIYARYSIDESRPHLNRRDVIESMRYHLGRDLGSFELPLLIDRPVILTMRNGEAAEDVFARLERGIVVPARELAGRGLSATLSPVPDGLGDGQGYHR